MKVLTELELREHWKREPFTCYSLPSDIRMTPAARQFLTDRRIEVIDQSRREGPEKGKSDQRKPEEQCALRGTELVPKHHPRIRFRGLADSFYGMMVEAELLVEEKQIPQLQQELRVLRKYAAQIIVAEASGKALPFIDFYGWPPEEIRSRSHDPLKHYGIRHFRVHPLDGPVMARLNCLRTRVRELEVAACEVFGRDDGDENRPDLILALNRFSSLAYILMCRLKAGVYGTQSHTSGHNQREDL